MNLGNLKYLGHLIGIRMKHFFFFFHYCCYVSKFAIFNPPGITPKYQEYIDTFLYNVMCIAYRTSID